ncbi:hypothetical protein BRAS3843_680019 [Bradyrhizobium sp. STM 3843]|nr:hypothetical protein BRAS3843_680019 [Bradyrhizobium sp. STM 3843]
MMDVGSNAMPTNTVPSRRRAGGRATVDTGRTLPRPPGPEAQGVKSFTAVEEFILAALGAISLGAAPAQGFVFRRRPNESSLGAPRCYTVNFRRIEKTPIQRTFALSKTDGGESVRQSRPYSNVFSSTCDISPTIVHKSIY